MCGVAVIDRSTGARNRGGDLNALALNEERPCYPSFQVDLGEDRLCQLRCGTSIALSVIGHSETSRMGQVMSEDKIRAAVNNCLRRCYHGETPLGVIAEFAGELRESGWQEDAVRKVESSVRRVLAGVMDDGDPLSNES